MYLSVCTRFGYTACSPLPKRISLFIGNAGGRCVEDFHDVQLRQWRDGVLSGLVGISWVELKLFVC